MFQLLPSCSGYSSIYGWQWHFFCVWGNENAQRVQSSRRAIKCIIENKLNTLEVRSAGSECVHTTDGGSDEEIWNFNVSILSHQTRQKWDIKPVHTFHPHILRCCLRTPFSRVQKSEGEMKFLWMFDEDDDGENWVLFRSQIPVVDGELESNFTSHSKLCSITHLFCFVWAHKNNSTTSRKN